MDKKSTPWQAGAKASAVLSLFYAVYTLSGSAGYPFDLISLISGFFIWWVVCAGVVWLWRKANR
jgi:hypothetical protein